MRSAPPLVAVVRVLLPCAAALSLLAGAAAAATIEIDGPAGANVTVDGKSVGRLPLAAPLSLEPGRYSVSCSLAGYEAFAAVVNLQQGNETRRLQARLIPLRRRDAVLFSLAFAGLGQRYEGRPLLGLALTGIEAGGLLTGLAAELSLRNRRDDYVVLYDAYRNALYDEDLAARRAAAEDAWRKVEDAASLRDTGLLVAAGAVVVSVLDAWLRFPGLEAGAGALPPRAAGLGADPTETTDAPAAAAGSLAGSSLHLAWTARF